MTEPGQGGLPAQEKPAAAPAAAVPATPVTIGIDDFQKIALRVGTILTAQEHPNADRLLVLTIDIGEPAPRQLVAGIRASYQAAELIGKQVVVVANLKPATLRGVESQGMVLAGSHASTFAVLNPDKPLPPGSIVK